METNRMQHLVGNLWTVGKVISTEMVVQSVGMVQNIQDWRKNRVCKTIEGVSPDEEIHKILNMYSSEDLGEKAERYLMNLRTNILDIVEEYENDYRVHIYIFRNAHSFGNGKNCIVINITDSNIDMKVKTNKQKEANKGQLSVVNLASSTKNALQRVSSFNFL